MAERQVHVQPLRTGAMLWGPARVAAGISLKQLADESGITRGWLSLAERGRYVPDGRQFEQIVAALARLGVKLDDQPTELEMRVLDGNR